MIALSLRPSFGSILPMGVTFQLLFTRLAYFICHGVRVNRLVKDDGSHPHDVIFVGSPLYSAAEPHEQESEVAIRTEPPSRVDADRSTIIATSSWRDVAALLLSMHPLRAFQISALQGRSRSSAREGAVERLAVDSIGGSGERRRETTWQTSRGQLPCMKQKARDKVVVEGEVCNVALTHANADFDSLAGAVALAKLWRVERPEHPTHVVMPERANPIVQRFVAYHKHLLPLRRFGTIMDKNIRGVGIIDAHSSQRLGPAAKWLRNATHIEVFDHHMAADSDINATVIHIEPVGSCTTMLVERLKELMEHDSSVEITPAEATLFSLGIRADTGGLTYNATTERDLEAVLWLMKKGSSQSAIADFGQARMSDLQRELLQSVTRDLRTTMHNGLKLGVAVLDTGTYVNGIAMVVMEALQMLALDCIILASYGGNQKVSLIGRCSARAGAVNLVPIFGQFPGKSGGHPHAASAMLQMTSSTPVLEQADAILEEILQAVRLQIPEQVTAGELMTKDVNLQVVYVNSTIGEANDLLDSTMPALPIVDDDFVFIGMVKKTEAVKAVESGSGAKSVKGFGRKANIIPTVYRNESLERLEELIVKKDVGRIPVVDESGLLVGVLTRTDILLYRKLYDTM